MIARFRVWLNSLQAHMIGFAFGVIAVMTAMNVAFVVIDGLRHFQGHSRS
jgi:hypothetical protein